MTPTVGRSVRPTVGDLSGAVADLGVFVPLSAALIVVNGLRPGPVLVAAGLLVILSGLRFRLPWPVQPLKALTAIAVGQGLSADLVHAGGLLVGVCLLLLTATGWTPRLAAWFTKPVIRSLQLGVGGLLVLSALRLVAAPPPVFTRPPPPARGLWLLVVATTVVAVVAWRRWYGTGVAGVAVGTVVSVAAAAPQLGVISPSIPVPAMPDLGALPAAFALLVVPQLPLTFGNAVVGVSDLAREHFGDRAGRVTPSRVAISAGLANVGSAFLGGMPMCHGSSGFTAHVRLGARNAGMNVVLGATLLVVGITLPRQVLALFGALPVWALGGFLAYAGLRHALLVADLRGRDLTHALVAGGIGLATGNLAVATAVALVLAHAPRVLAPTAPALPTARTGA
ncbi:MAG: putative sulfate/molybdate transporter [Actinobacteria bacterium]|nr:putative sulfate/molybdate transporter [Actinomycetota bacterium]